MVAADCVLHVHYVLAQRKEWAVEIVHYVLTLHFYCLDCVVVAFFTHITLIWRASQLIVDYRYIFQIIS